MKARLKQFAERIARHEFWIGRSADQDEIFQLIRALRPRGTVAPLIRIGPNGDGGYLLPDDLDGVSACISPGVSFEIGFDRAMADRGIEVYMVDASVPGPPKANDRFHFTRKFLDVFEDDNHIRFDTFCTAIPSVGDLVLQMDIEGAEWRVLLDTSPETIKRFRIMAIEFHDLKEMFGRFSFDLIQATFTKLLRTHSIVHLHPNNISNSTCFAGLCVPSLMEITFYRNDRAFSKESPSRFPHPLDADNVATRPTVVLPRCWWNG